MRTMHWIGLFFTGIFVAACDGGSTTSTGGAGGSSTSSTSSSGGSGGTTGGSGGSATGGEAGHGGSGMTGGAGGTTGGSGGMGQGGGGAGGSAGGAGGSGGGSSGGPCQWSLSNPCADGFYCKAPGCGMGTCQPIVQTEIGDRMPVCGCDGVTYWNDSIAASHGMAVSGPGECVPPAAVFCGGFGGIQCPAGASCNYEVPNKAGCGIADGGGYCWGMPKMCGGGIGFGPITRECGAAVCKDECELIKSELPWYVDNTCPQ